VPEEPTRDEPQNDDEPQSEPQPEDPKPPKLKGDGQNPLPAGRRGDLLSATEPHERS
jgi:hypothetical protein